MKNHPGILFILIIVPASFLIGFLVEYFRLTRIACGSIIFFWLAIIYWWIVYFHTKWLESLFKKQK